MMSNYKNKFETHELTQYVNPIIGTDDHGHTFPGAIMPFGMVQLSPDTRLDSWDGCSGYHYTDSIIYGFSHTHLSGTGVSDYGDILLMPMSGFYSTINISDNPNQAAYTSVFSHDSEVAEPGYYSVHLKNPDVNVELSVTDRVGIHKYKFNKKEEHYIILDLEHRDMVLKSGLTKVSDTRYTGVRNSKAWAENQILYFVIDFSVPVEIVDLKLNPQFETDEIIEIDESILQAESFDSKFGVFAFQLNDNEADEVFVKVAISQVSESSAIENLEKELPDFDFDKVKENAKQAWENELSRIIVKGGSEEQKKVFYTALYHAFTHPTLATDVNEKYRGTDLEIHQASDFTNYTVFSLWDTYRATHPLFTIVQQKRSLDFIKTFLSQYKYGGQLPMWELSANETGCMIGYHAVPPIVDAYFKGIVDFDIQLAMEAMIARAEADELGKHDYAKYGFLPVESEHESVSKTLEYAYNDWCIAMFAKALGKNKVYKDYIVRSQSYKNILDPEIGFMRPRMNGAWKTPFDPKEVDHNFTEANSWQYSFYAPQDILSMIELMGGNEKFENQLDNLFAAESETHGKDLKDITGLIGQYAHGNEPSHHVAYLYNYCARPDKAQEMVRRIMSEMYHSGPAGLCGNEDCGQMSAWYVLSAMGFYPVNPANTVYDIGSPIFDTAIIQLENGKRFSIITHNNSDENIYVEKIKLNGKNYNKTYLMHSDIIKGGKIEFFMSNTVNKDFGTKQEHIYQSKIDDYLITRTPYSNIAKKTFTDSIQVHLKSYDENAVIYYSFDKNDDFIEYKEPLNINSDVKIFFYAKEEGKLPSKPIFSEYILVDGSRSVNLKTKYSSLYPAGGDDALIDRLKGKNDFRSGEWQGYSAQDFEAIVDLGSIKDIKSIETGFLQDQRSWIMMPKYVEYSFSRDGRSFVSANKISHQIADNEEHTVIHRFLYEPKNQKARYIKVFAPNYGKLPKWHISAGNYTWLFADEIDIIAE
ncbi:MAG: glycoside hydrolase family 92 protein [Bacteroidales bacterium]|nr:glycoside hydrolase family 92 protein [Bacteroidales bacterium]